MKFSFALCLALAVGIATLQAQAPQAICYQALAKDQQGNDLADQPVSIRASLLRGGPNGELLWEEVHPKSGQSLLTDPFGIFTINVGEGERTGGTLSSFDAIDWADGSYWLRIELDAQGGSDFEFMGANRIVSVPYALHANTAGSAAHAQFADSAQVAASAAFAAEAGHALTAEQAQRAAQADTSSFAHLAGVALSIIGDNDLDDRNELQQPLFENDSLYLLAPDGSRSPGLHLPTEDADADPANELQTLEFDGETLSISGGNAVSLREDKKAFSALGATPDFPQGILGQHIVLGGGNYQVPPGKTLWLTAAGPSILLPTHGGAHPTTPNMPVLPQLTTVQNCYCTGFLTDTTSQVQPIIIELDSSGSTYVVPPGKVLFIKSGLENDEASLLTVNGTIMEFMRPNFTRGTRIMVFPAETVLQKPNIGGTTGSLFLTGYLVDE